MKKHKGSEFICEWLNLNYGRVDTSIKKFLFALAAFDGKVDSIINARHKILDEGVTESEFDEFVLNAKTFYNAWKDVDARYFSIHSISLSRQFLWVVVRFSRFEYIRRVTIIKE